MTDWLARLEPFGADRQALHALDADGPELLPYATLTNARRDSGSILGVVGAVYEWQDAPLVFLVDANQIDGTGQIHRLRRLLAMRRISASSLPVGSTSTPLRSIVRRPPRRASPPTGRARRSRTCSRIWPTAGRAPRGPSRAGSLTWFSIS
ncbi:MAG: restriction endonuclease subunit [Rhodospirillales bacterium]|nr:restriction endonuclease subunit [Rhodospirillales bacterium]